METATNDLSMFEYASTKVAMGNGSPKIRELADYVTTDMFHYGIQKGLQNLDLSEQCKIQCTVELYRGRDYEIRENKNRGWQLYFFQTYDDELSAV